MAATLRVALIGAGRMGANHARVLSGIGGVRLAGIHDAVPAAAEALAGTYSCPVLGAIDSLRGRADAVIIAASSAAHAALGQAVLAQGIPCLIEKPLATTEADCRALIRAAEKAGVPLAVGHVERFNPAVAAAAELLAGEEILAIEGRRLNPGSARIQDTDVVMDLMVHDIDTVLHLTAAAPVSVQARGVAVASPDLADHASAILAFASGAVASLTAGRISQVRIRELVILCREGSLTLDYLAQSLSMAQAGSDGAKPVPVQQAQSLERELTTYLEAVREQRPVAGVSGSEALSALGVVWRIQAALASGFPDRLG